MEVPPEQITRLKKIAAKLPEIPFQLTDKNKALLEQFESDRVRAELLFLPERLIGEFNKGVNQGRLDFVKAQVAIAIEFELTIPLRPQNLSRLNWKRHFSEPDGPKGRLLLQIPKAEMKSRKDDFVAEVPDHVARRLRWYRRHIFPASTLTQTATCSSPRRASENTRKRSRFRSHERSPTILGST